MNVERWLNLFSVQMLFVMLVVLVFFMVVTPITDAPVVAGRPEPPESAVQPANDAFSFMAHCPPDYRAAASALLIAVGSFAGAVVWRFLRRSASARPGPMVWLLLLSTAFWLQAAWSAYRPTCMWW